MVNSSNILRQILVVFLILISLKGFSQLSKKHFIPPLTSAQFGNANPENQYIYISTPNAGNVPYTIIPVGQPAANYITGTVTNVVPVQISLGSGNGQLFVPSTQTSTVRNDVGYIIEAEAPIYVSVRMNAGGGAQAGALVSKGASALGTTFRVGTYTNSNPQDNYLNFVSVMATEDNTVVNFTDLDNGLDIKNYTGPIPLTRTLNEGESYTIALNSFDALINRTGLIGCLVNSDKPIVVNCGSANGSFGNGGGRDYGIDQIAGLDKVGNEYIFVRGDGTDEWENALIVAHFDNTSISINGTAGIATINAGEFYVIEGNQFNASGNMYVETSQDVFAYQGVGSNSEANQGMFFVPPLSCETRGNINNIANIDIIGSTVYSGGLSIVTKAGANVTINNQDLTNFSSIGPNNVDGKLDYVTYKITGLNGNVSVQGDDELYVAYFNVNGFATSGSFYSGFPSPPEINFDAQFASLGNCIPNITLEAANIQNFDSFEWQYDDGLGLGFQGFNTTDAIITPVNPGKYKLIGILTCTLVPLESIEIPVSICPDDRDNDGIIDNIDIDNDNDGIENCYESNGDATINLNNTNNPIIEFQDGSSNSTIVSSTYTETSSSGNTNSFGGDDLGNFTSVLGDATTAEGNYTLNFTEPVNIRFTEPSSVPNTVSDDEYFITRILPSNKNITLVDPDGQLLIDSNFDGIFETGVTQISGSEIHFKINTATTGTTPFQFLANSIESFYFIHRLSDSNALTPSTFYGNISLTCFKKDSDNDGIKDAHDLDSDNDGIPDIIERSGTIISLSGNDANNDGLDDIFTNFSDPIDTDNDGIIDVYDLDSDNDGIYDIIETGQLGISLSDTNLDGIEDSPAYGANGWVDAAETSPDSNQIGYTLDDLDSDTTFSYLDTDSDGDFCSDVIEAGFSDDNADNLLGNSAPTIDTNGLVNNATDGYTQPNADYLTAAPITIDSQTTADVTCEGSTITIPLVSPDTETINWEISTDNGTTWNSMTNDATFTGTSTFNLTINNTPLNVNNSIFRAFLNRSGNTCGLYSPETNITVNPLPTVTTPVTLVQCDDDDPSSLGFSFINLTEANDNISSDAANQTFTYYTTQIAAEIGDTTSTEYISNFSAYENNNSGGIGESVWARVENINGCHNVAEIDLVITATQIPNPNLQLYKCDDDLDINGDNNSDNNKRDGIATFDLTSATIVIPPGLNTLPPRYYRNEADALAEENEITNLTDYRNIDSPGMQEIFVRIDSNIDNSCVGLGAFITLHVEELPTANTVTVLPQCDEDLTDALVSYSFNTSSIEASILNGQSLADVNITYSYLDISGTAMSTNTLPNPFQTETQDVSVVLTNNNTQSPDGPCEDETIINFIVNEQPIIAAIIPIQEFCDGAAGDIDDDGIYPFDTTTFASTILGSQAGTMDIFYDYINENGDLITNSPNLPDTLNSENQTISVRLVNPSNINCEATTTIDLVVYPLPEFNILPEDGTICTTSTPVAPVPLEAQLADPTENFMYEWRWTNLDGTIVDDFLSNDESIFASQPGIYYLILTKTDGTGCDKRKEILVDSAQEAILDITNITISNPSHTHNVTIKDPTLLGPDTYEYALVDEDSNIVSYQENPVFNNVKPGFYTLYARDVDRICDPSLVDISVIGYQRFFTPNGDGANEFWNIKGIDNTQANSIIRIYDRYGKLIKQILSLSDGWDGTFNGKPMPNDDYWFKVNLEDGISFMGHFTLKR